MVEGLVIEQITLLALARGVANHTRGTAHQDDGFMSTSLQMTEHHDTTQMANVERIGRRVRTEIGRNHLLFKQFFGTRHHLCQHTAPLKFFYKVHIVSISFFSLFSI